KSIGTAVAGQAVQDLSYAYDARLNLASRTDALQMQLKTESFDYDALDRLKCAKLANPGTKCKYTYDYAPNGNGNLTYKPGFGALHYDDPAHPHAVTSMDAPGMPNAYTYSYDKVGNQHGRPGVALVTYAPFDLPASLSTAAGEVSFDYDGHQRRI